MWLYKQYIDYLIIPIGNLKKYNACNYVSAR